MDDKKVFELKSLELAYNKQLMFMLGGVLISIIGLILYIVTVYSYNFQLLAISLMLVITGIVSMITVDGRMKDISKKMKGL